MKNNLETKIAVITGASSGIGFATAQKFLDAGYIVYNLSRSEPKEKSASIFIKTDITDAKVVQSSIKEIIKQQNKIDVLVNNAGFGISGSVEGTSLEDAKKLFEVNFFGSLSVTKAVLPFMRQAKCGRIINIGSVASLMPLPFQGFYSAVKAALLSLTRAQNIELKPFNIKSVCMLPGDVKTNFTAAREKNIKELDCYNTACKRSIAKMEKDEQNGLTPAYIAKQVFKAATKKNPPPQVVCGASYKFLMLLTRFLPTRTVDFILRKMYG